MAAVAVAGAAAAQVTITGAIGARFESSVNAAGTEDKGIGMSDSAIKFSTSEDLGGGLSLAASAGFENMTKMAVHLLVPVSLSRSLVSSVLFLSQTLSQATTCPTTQSPQSVMALLTTACSTTRPPSTASRVLFSMETALLALVRTAQRTQQWFMA